MKFSVDLKHKPRAGKVEVGNSENFDRTEIVCVWVRERGRPTELGGSELERGELVSSQRVCLETKRVGSLRDDLNNLLGDFLSNTDQFNVYGVPFEQNLWRKTGACVVAKIFCFIFWRDVSSCDQ